MALPNPVVGLAVRERKEGRLTASPVPPTLSGVAILELTQRYPPAIGGVERHVERLARGLASAGARVEVSTTDLLRDRPFARIRLDSEDGPVAVRRHRVLRAIPAPQGLGLAAPGMFADALRAEADFVHAHAFGYFPTWVGRAVRSLRGIPLVITPHSDPGRDNSLSRLYARAVAHGSLQGADRIVALTQREADWLTGLDVPRERIRVIPNGIDLEEFADLPPRPIGSATPVVLFVGRLHARQKGLEPLIEAFALLPRTLNARLRLVGEDWGGLDPLLDRARELGVVNRVVATGPLPRADLLGELASADLLVVPSLFEPFGIVLLEAMAAGLPIVATRVGGIPEVVVDRQTALLVRPGASAELAAAMEAVLTDPSLAQNLGTEGRRRVTRFAWPRLLPMYVALFRELADERRR
jgi:glycosyltransferase involved in cell wall biosynthesis